MIHINKSEWDCIVVGAGMSGLACASSLAEKGHRVLVLEARDRIGGRVHTVWGPNKEAVDLGASFVHGVDGNPLTQLAKDNGVKLYENSLEGLNFKEDGSVMDKKVSGKIEANLFTTLFDTARNYSKNHLIPATTSLDDYLTATDSPLFEGLNDEEKEYARQMSHFLDGWTGASLDKVSFKYWGFEREFEGDDKVVADGYVHLVEVLQKKLLAHGGKILLSTPITTFTYDEDAGLVCLTDSSGTTYSARSTICTLSLGILKKSPPKFEPSLPPRRTDAIKKVGFGLLNKVIITYPSLWWPKDVSALHIFLPKSSAGVESVGEDLNDSPLPSGMGSGALFAQCYYPMTKQPMLMFFFGGSHGEELEKLSDDKIKTWLHGALKRCLLGLPGAPPSAPEPSAIFVTRWLSDPFAYGSYAYTHVATPEELARGEEHPSPLHMIELSRPLWDMRLGFAGEHTELDHFASVHGPVVSGWREADRVHAALEDPWAALRKS